jgi:hypothetical protein
MFFKTSEIQARQVSASYTLMCAELQLQVVFVPRGIRMGFWPAVGGSRTDKAVILF